MILSVTAWVSLTSNLTDTHISTTEWMSLNAKTHLYSLPPPKKGPGVAKNDDSEIIEISRYYLSPSFGASL